jgi:hypothetical protein
LAGNLLFNAGSRYLAAAGTAKIKISQILRYNGVMDKKAWVISVNMGYGHQRTAFPLRDVAEGGIINANDYEGIPKGDRNTWEGMRTFYEFISNFKRVPLIGQLTFSIFDRVQKILSFYPRRDLSKPNLQLKQIFSNIKKGWGKHLIDKIKTEPLPMVSTFFTPAFMAESFDYPGDIFCVVCDADISRTWVPLEGKSSRIRYFAPTERVAERLKLYGVRAENIFLTGYPLPKELIGTEKMEILKENLKYRLLNLDPKKRYFSKYKTLIAAHLGSLPERPDHPLTILFSIGGAGAQKEIAIRALRGLREKIKAGQLKIILSSGIREKIKNYFEAALKNLDMEDCLGKNVEILFCQSIENYFKEFNERLRKTDILWTKPSELSFYSALGIPIIVAPPIGSQEEFNMRWLLKSGFGISQENPRYIGQWLFDWLEQGYLAEAAMQGFVEGEKLGTFNIENIIFPK